MPEIQCSNLRGVSQEIVAATLRGTRMLVVLDNA